MKIRKTVPDLEKKLGDALRNMPLGTQTLIASSQEIPPEYKNSSVFAHAHSVYWQMQGYEAFMKTVDQHPV